MKWADRILTVAGCALLLLTGWTLSSRAVAPLAFGRAQPLLLAADSVPTIFLVFQPADCASMAGRLALWNDVMAERGLRIRGVLVEARGLHELTRLRADYRLAFPLSLAGPLEVALIRRLGYTSTPLFIVTDPFGRIRFTGPADTMTTPEAVDDTRELAVSLRAVPRPAAPPPTPLDH